MTYTTLLAHLDLEGINDEVCAVTGQLAAMMDADVIGVAACQPLPLFPEMPAGETLELDRTEIVHELSVAESLFRVALKGKAKQISFRSQVSYADLAGYIADQARAADLIITGPAIHYDMMDTTRRTDIDALVIAAGRPVLIVPPKTKRLNLKSIVIAWKDTREARRAVADALPLLSQAEEIAIVEIASEPNMSRALARVQDVRAWLERHRIAAEVLVQRAEGPDVDCLYRVLEERHCDLVVAGAYGHSRLREWGFGGVTMDLLVSPDRCALLSH